MAKPQTPSRAAAASAPSTQVVIKHWSDDRREHLYKVDRVAKLVQEASTSEITEFFREVDHARMVNDITSDSYLVGRYAMTRKDGRFGQVFDVLLRFGLDPNLEDMMGSLLIYMCKEEHPDSARVLLEMLVRGGNPEAISPQRVTAMQLANNDLKKFYLMEATKIAVDHNQERFKAIKAPLLPKLRLSCIGQEVGKGLLLDAVAACLVDQHRAKPRVILLAGPPGHGKTMCAEMLGKLLDEVPLLKVDCGAYSCKLSFFGSYAAYQNSETSTAPTRFVAKNAGKRSIMLLDEFDRLEEAVKENLLIPFDQGQWTSHSATYGDPGEVLDCTKTIFILTTNILDSDIDYFMDDNRSLVGCGRERFHESFDAFIRPQVIEYFREPLARRIDDVIPFLPFSIEEQRLVAESIYYDLAGRYRHEPEPPICQLGHLRMMIANPAVFKVLARYYSPREGASSIARVINSRIGDKLCRFWVSGKLDVGQPGRPRHVHVYPRGIEGEVIVDVALEKPKKAVVDEAVKVLGVEEGEVVPPAAASVPTRKAWQEDGEVVVLPKLCLSAL